MKAILCKSYGTPENLVLEDIEDLKPREGEVLVEVYAASLNFPDTLQIEGKYQYQPPFPFIPGSEAGGIIKELGSNVSNRVSKLDKNAASFILQGAIDYLAN